MIAKLLALQLILCGPLALADSPLSVSSNKVGVNDDTPEEALTVVGKVKVQASDASSLSLTVEENDLTFGRTDGDSTFAQASGGSFRWKIGTDTNIMQLTPTVTNIWNLVYLRDHTSCSNGLKTDANGEVQCMPSSARFKTNIMPYEAGMSLVNKLSPVTFNWVDPADGLQPEPGLIAEEVATVAPEFVFYDKDGRVYGVLYQAMTALLINALQEQDATIQSLEERIAALEARP